MYANFLFLCQNLTVDNLLANLIQTVVEEIKLGKSSENSLQLLCEVLLVCINDNCVESREKFSCQCLHFLVCMLRL